MRKNWKGWYLLLQRYLEGTINPLKKQAIDFWYDSLGAGEEDKVLSDKERTKTEIWNSIRGDMLRQETEYEPVFVRRWWQTVYFKSAMAVVPIVLGLTFYINQPENPAVIAGVEDEVIKDLVVKFNQSSLEETVVLPDGSVVMLDPGAFLYHPRTFEKGERRVFLKGSGFFNVKPDKASPFLVFADHIVTRVLGTSFSIKKNEKGEMEVAVATGVVSVHKNTNDSYASRQEDNIVLTANKKVTFYPEMMRMVNGIVDHPQLISNAVVNTPGFSFNFRDVPLPEIARKLGEAYGMEIRILTSELQNCSITADVSQSTDLFVQLEILCAAVGANFEVKGDSILLSGDGCP